MVSVFVDVVVVVLPQTPDDDVRCARVVFEVGRVNNSSTGYF